MHDVVLLLGASPMTDLLVFLPEYEYCVLVLDQCLSFVVCSDLSDLHLFCFVTEICL